MSLVWSGWYVTYLSTQHIKGNTHAHLCKSQITYGNPTYSIVIKQGLLRMPLQQAPECFCMASTTAFKRGHYTTDCVFPVKGITENALIHDRDCCGAHWLCWTWSSLLTPYIWTSYLVRQAFVKRDAFVCHFTCWWKNQRCERTLPNLTDPGTSFHSHAACTEQIVPCSGMQRCLGEVLSLMPKMLLSHSPERLTVMSTRVLSSVFVVQS